MSQVQRQIRCQKCVGGDVFAVMWCERQCQSFARQHKEQEKEEEKKKKLVEHSERNQISESFSNSTKK